MKKIIIAIAAIVVLFNIIYFAASDILMGTPKMLCTQ